MATKATMADSSSIKRSSFEDGDLFCSLELGAEISKPQVIKGLLSNKEKKICPRCQKPGTGLYSRWVRNSIGRVYTPYFYFAHKTDAKIKWCYISRVLAKEMLDNLKVMEASI